MELILPSSCRISVHFEVTFVKVWVCRTHQFRMMYYSKMQVIAPVPPPTPENRDDVKWIALQGKPTDLVSYLEGPKESCWTRLPWVLTVPETILQWQLSVAWSSLRLRESTWYEQETVPISHSPISLLEKWFSVMEKAHSSWSLVLTPKHLMWARMTSWHQTAIWSLVQAE